MFQHYGGSSLTKTDFKQMHNDKNITDEDRADENIALIVLDVPSPVASYKLRGYVTRE